MAIQDDFTIFPYSKCVRHVDGQTTVYSAVAFYSFLKDYMEEPGFGTHESAIKFNTPTSFSWTNGWMGDDGDGSEIYKYITGGSFDTVDNTTVGDPVYMQDCTSTTDWITSDKDLPITAAAALVGPLIAYKNDYPVANSARIWVRDTEGNPPLAAEAIATTGGTGAGTANGNGLNGDENYVNLFGLIDVPTDVSPQFYVYQEHPADSTIRVRIAEWSGLTNWMRGALDVIIPTRLGGVLVDSGNVTVLCHNTGDTFTSATVDLSAGARTPVSIETGADETNVPSGEWYLLYDGEAGGGFTADDLITDIDTTTGTRPGWYAEVVTVQDDGSDGYLLLRNLREDTATLDDNDNIFVGSTVRGVANGTHGDTHVTYDVEATIPVVGDVGKPIVGSVSTGEAILRGFHSDAGSGKMVLQVHHAKTAVDGRDYGGTDDTNRATLYINLVDNDQMTAASGGSSLLDVTLDANSTKLISAYSDITVAHISGTVTTSSPGTFTVGERITWNAGGSEAIYISGTTTMFLGNIDPTDEPDAADVFVGQLSAATANCDSGLTDDNTDGFAFEQQSSFDYSVLVEGGSIYNTGRTVPQIYRYLQYKIGDGNPDTIFTSDGATITATAAEEYTRADPAYATLKATPYANLAGTLFQGAQGVWLQGMATADANNLSLLDDLNAPHTPFASINLTVNNTRVDDVIWIHLDDGTGLTDKDTYASHNTNNLQSDSTFERDATNFPIDTPASGTFTVVDLSANREHRYRYISWATTILTLPAESTGTATAGSDGAQALEDDTTLDFVAAAIQRGDIIRRTNGAGGYAYVIEVVDADNVTTTQLSAGAGWVTGDTYELNSLVVTYDNTDLFLISYMDEIETVGTEGSPGTAQVSLLYLQDRAIILRARNVQNATKLIDIKATGTIESGGYTVTLGRNEDTVFTV